MCRLNNGSTLNPSALICRVMWLPLSKKGTDMEIVKFESKTWQEIPDQDNPAMHLHEYPEGHRRPDECIMIFKGRHRGITDGGLVVAHVPLRGDIVKKGVFWTVENAEAFANLLAT